MTEMRRKKEKPLNSIAEDFSLPLTEAQKEMWLAARMSEAASRAHNNTFVIHLRGDLRLHALLECLQELVDRHDALRTSFDLSEPKQYVAASSRIRTPIVDLTQKAQAEKEAELTAAIQSESDQAFDVTMSPLLRARLVKLSASDHVLLLTSNHLVADNWSVDVLLDELKALYAGRVQGMSARLAPAMQFREYVRLLNEPAQRESMSVGEAYWLQQFTEPPAPTDLPSDFRRPVMRTYEAGEESRWLGPDLSQMMRRASAKQECSAETFLLAVFKVLVNRLTGQEDLVVAIPAAGQTAAWLKQESGSGALVGHCVNFLPVRSYCRTHLTFTDYLKTLETVVLNACKHQSFTYGSLLAKMPLPRDPGRTPLVSLVFHLDRAATGFNLQGLDTEVQEAPRRTALFDLELKVAEFDQDLKIACTFNSDLFAAQTIQRWLNHYRTLLADVLENPDKRVSELALLTTEEQRQILVEWNDTAAAYPREGCVHELFEEQVLRTPDSVAVVCEDRQLTYNELNQQANQLAHYLRSLGVGPETLVGLCLERSPELVVAVLGILKAGGAYVPLDPTYPSKRLSFLVQDCHAALILTHSRFLDQLGEAQTRVVCVDKCKRAISAEGNKNLAIEMTPDQPLYVLYTSGSTGTPKGVVGLHRGTVNRVTWMWRTYPFAPDEVACLKTTFSFVDSVWEMFGGLLCGVRTIVIPDRTVKDPLALVNTLATHGVTRIVLVPSLLRVLLENCGDLRGKVPQLRIFISSGEALSLELSQRFRRMLPDARLINLYGSSEVAADVTCCDTTEDVLPTYIPIGRPIANTQVYVLDAQRQPVPISVPGELYVGGAGVARGYLNRPELTAERFVGNPFDDDPDSRLFRTGDLCRWRADGNLEFLGRLDGQVKLRGFRIELGEIESVLDEHPDVAQSVVTLREDHPGDKRLAAYYVPTTAIACEAEELRRFLGKRLPDYMVPSAYVFLQALPLTPNGKVDRRALPSISAAERRSAGFIEPRDNIERKLTKIWEELLGVKPIGVKDNFFDLGGHSSAGGSVDRSHRKELGERFFVAAVSVTHDRESGPGTTAKEKGKGRFVACSFSKRGGPAPVVCTWGKF